VLLVQSTILVKYSNATDAQHMLSNYVYTVDRTALHHITVHSIGLLLLLLFLALPLCQAGAA
jgi:hypothetical protein